MDNGYIKYYRSILNNHICCKNQSYFAVWNYLLLNANHQTSDTIFAGKKMQILTGQLITSRRTIANFWNITESTVQRILLDLENDGQIAQENLVKARLITIVEWAKYQINDEPKTKKLKIKQKKTTTDITPKSEQKQNLEYLKIVDGFIAKKLTDETFKNSRYLLKPNIAEYYKSIDELQRLDNYSIDTIIAVLDFSMHDAFWSNKIVSLSKVREKSARNGLSKFENCRLSMETEKNYKIQHRR